VNGLEVRSELDYDLLGKQTIVRVKYRRRGIADRRWTRFVIVPDVGQDIGEILAHVDDAAAVHFSQVPS